MNDPLCEPFEFGDDPTALYRIYDAEGVLIYIGIAIAPARRMEEHADRQPWWPEVARKTMVWYSTRTEASTAEAAAIRAEKPKYNKKDTRANARLHARWMTDAEIKAALGAGEWVWLTNDMATRRRYGSRPGGEDVYPTRRRLGSADPGAKAGEFDLPAH